MPIKIMTLSKSIECKFNYPRRKLWRSIDKRFKNNHTVPIERVECQQRDRVLVLIIQLERNGSEDETSESAYRCERSRNWRKHDELQLFMIRTLEKEDVRDVFNSRDVRSFCHYSLRVSSCFPNGIFFILQRVLHFQSSDQTISFQMCFKLVNFSNFCFSSTNYIYFNHNLPKTTQIKIMNSYSATERVTIIYLTYFLYSKLQMC